MPPTNTGTLTLPSEAATARAAQALIAALRPGDVVLLSGPLGAGKSAFARAAILSRLRAAGREEPAPSPSYTLVQVYETPTARLVHADLYRLSDPDEIAELGLPDTFDDAISLVEWGERLGPLTPPRALRLGFGFGPSPEMRTLDAEGVGGGWNRALAALRGAAP